MDLKRGELHEINGVYYKLVNPNRLFNKLCEKNWNYAEPGILLWNHREEYNLLNNNKDFSYTGVDPCAEISLPGEGSCLLDSLNLSEFANKPFAKEVHFDSFQKVTFEAIVGLNKVLYKGFIN